MDFGSAGRPEDVPDICSRDAGTGHQHRAVLRTGDFLHPGERLASFVGGCGSSGTQHPVHPQRKNVPEGLQGVFGHVDRPVEGHGQAEGPGEPDQSPANLGIHLARSIQGADHHTVPGHVPAFGPAVFGQFPDLADRVQHLPDFFRGVAEIPGTRAHQHVDGNLHGPEDLLHEVPGRGDPADCQFHAQFDPAGARLLGGKGFFKAVAANLDDHGRKLTEKYS